MRHEYAAEIEDKGQRLVRREGQVGRSSTEVHKGPTQLTTSFLNPHFLKHCNSPLKMGVNAILMRSCCRVFMPHS